MKELQLNLHEFILILTAAEAIFLAVVLRLLSADQKQPRTLLSVLFCLLAGMLTCNMILWSPSLAGWGINKTPIVAIVFVLCSLLQGPALYFYFRSLLSPVNFKQTKNLAHAVPALISVFLILVLGLDSAEILPTTQLDPFREMVTEFIWAAAKCLPLFYVVASIFLEVRIRKELKQVVSAEPTLEFNLANIVLFGFFIHWLWSVLAYLLGEFVIEGLPINDAIGMANDYLAFIMVNVLFAFGYLNARQGIMLLQNKATKSSNPDRTNAIADAINEAINQKKLYLESDINLERFSKEIGFSSRDVSYVINTNYKSNFFEFINSYRVEEAKKLLVSVDYKDKTILDIIFLSGFNSQSAFHRFFKRLTNVTPSEYRKTNKEY